MRCARTAGGLALVALSATIAVAAPSPAQLHPAHFHAVTSRNVATPVPDAGSDARPLIVEAVAAPKHVSFVGQMSSIRSGNSRAFAVVSKVEHRAPDETRRTYLAPRSLYGQFVISRGAVSWDIDPTKKRVVVSKNLAAVDPVSVVDDIALLDANYRAVRSASDSVADRKTDVVDLVSRYTGERTMRIWIDAQTYVVLAKEAYHSDGSLAWRTRFDDIRYTDGIPEAIFAGGVPPGYASVNGRSYEQPRTMAVAVPNAGFRPFTPRYLPEGFALAGASVSVVNGVKNLHMVYSDGIRTLSLFENSTNRPIDFGGLPSRKTSFDEHEATYVRDGPTMLVAWREHGLSFALVGDLDLKELQQIGTSVVPDD